jgi:peptidoglycan/LPS O-acetylase OafA/YrhL
VVGWLGSSSDPFQPIVIPFNIGAIACIYLIGVALVQRRRSRRTRAMVQSGSDNSYGIYLAQVLLITMLSWLGWQHLNAYLPWQLVAVITVVVVFMACIALTELLARTPLAKPLTGRTRVPWRRAGAPVGAPGLRVVDGAGGADPAQALATGLPEATATGLPEEPATAAAMADAIAR